MHNHDEHEHHHHHDSEAADIPVDRMAVCPVTGDAIDTAEAEKLGHFRDVDGKESIFVVRLAYSYLMITQINIPQNYFTNVQNVVFITRINRRRRSVKLGASSIIVAILKLPNSLSNIGRTTN